MRVLIAWIGALFFSATLWANEVASGEIAGTGITVQIETARALQMGDNHFKIQLMREGQPLEGVQVEARAFKPHHGPQMPARDFRADATEEGGGLYRATLPLDHKCGTWRFGLSIQKDGERLGAFRASMPFL